MSLETVSVISKAAGESSGTRTPKKHSRPEPLEPVGEPTKVHTYIRVI